MYTYMDIDIETDIDTNTYINICMCAIHMGSTTGVIKDVSYRAKEGTKIHLIYPLKWKGEKILPLITSSGQVKGLTYEATSQISINDVC